MNQPFRFSSAASLFLLGSMIAGCAAPDTRLGSATHFGGKANVDTGLATRALAALNSNNVPMAIELAERAVAKTPKDAGFRALLGSAYFAAGRFHSAEAAYRDSLTLYPDQPQIVLKLALVQIAQGKGNAAVSLLNQNRGELNASDYGLALALAGQPGEAIAILEPAARATDADATVRQNLALAHALAGDWSEARTIASQDVPSNQLDARMHQWMQLASPQHPSDQVAALVGVKPAAVDAGQPVQLALNFEDTRLAEAASPKPAPLKLAEPTTAAKPPIQIAEAVRAGDLSVHPSIVPTVVPTAAPSFSPAPLAQQAASESRPTIASLAATAVTSAKAMLTSVLHSGPAAKPVKPRLAVNVRPQQHSGESLAVVQLGAYQSSQHVLAAWNGTAGKYPALKAYLPMSARFATPKGTFYRLSVRGFSSVSQATALCTTLHRQGGACFVRRLNGDSPVSYALR